MKDRRITLFLASASLLAVSIACGTFEVSIDPSPPVPNDGVVDSFAGSETPAATTDPIAQPLTLDSDSETIRLKLLRSHTFWQSIFIDGSIAWYPPEGGDQPSQVSRQQIWVDQADYRFRFLAGPGDGDAETFQVSDGQRVMEMDLKTGSTQTSALPVSAGEPYNPSPFVSGVVEPHPLDTIIATPFSGLIFPAGSAQSAGVFQPVAVEEIAGRRALVVEWFFDTGAPPNRRMWLDVQTGVVLREQDFGKTGGETVQNEYVIDQVLYDYPFDTTLFDLAPASLPQFSDVDGLPLAPAEPAPPPSDELDPLGQVYFFVSAPDVSLVRLPGSCVAGATLCPEPAQIETPFPLVHSLSPDLWAWSPDGDLAAFAYPIGENGKASALHLYDPETQTWESLAEFPLIDLVAWSPDGKWIAFRVQDGNGAVDTYVLRPDGTGLTNLTASEKLPAEDAPFIMDGWITNNVILRSAKLGKEGTVYLVRADDGVVRPLFEMFVTKSVLVPSPDGSFLAFTESDGASSKHTLKIVTPDGNTLRELAVFQSTLYPVVWSPDGASLAFNVYGSGPEDPSAVYIIGRDGRDLRQVYQGDVGNILFSPDGGVLLVEDISQNHLFLVDVSTLERRLLQAPGLALDQRWFMASWRP